MFRRYHFLSLLIAQALGFYVAAMCLASANTIEPRAEEVCDRAAHFAARKFGVPENVLRAIARAETGRNIDGRIVPWPWAINRAGAGEWFDAPQAALNRVQQAIKEGERNIDIGCFQLNFHWHGDAFSSLSEMFDPIKNAHYAAQFLRDLYLKKGNWEEATGAYHSRLSETSQRYLSKVTSFMEGEFDVEKGISMQSTSKSTQNLHDTNTYPLLRSNGKGQMGSLVPVNHNTPLTPLF